MQRIILTTVLVYSVLMVCAQEKDRAVFEHVKPGYYQNSILKGIDDFEEQTAAPEMVKKMKVDLSKWDIPNDPSTYKTVWYTNPISQGNTGTCWCFSTTSFYESEVKRITGKEVKLSEMWMVYWEYVERARYFVKTRGKMHLGEGSETNAVAKNMKQYGMVPWEAFNGLSDGQKFHNHEPMFKEFENYLAGVKKRNAWDEETVVKTVKSILEHYVGKVPTEVTVEGKKMTPLQYMKNVLKLNPDDYVDFMSLMDKPYWQKGEYEVPDNWWHSAAYYNVPLLDFMTGVKEAVDKGYSISIGGDVSEPGFDKIAQCGIIPSFDIPSAYIDENARLARFQNGATTDDHAMHLIGHKEHKGATWFLVKDSGSGSRNCGEGCKQFGYYFIHEDYVKLKFMSFTVHKDAVKNLLKKMQ